MKIYTIYICDTQSAQILHEVRWPLCYMMYVKCMELFLHKNLLAKFIQGCPYWTTYSFFSCSYCSCTIFVLTSYSLETQIMLILILIDVQYSQNAVFSFEKFLNPQNHSSSGSHHLVKKSPQQCSLLFDIKSGKLLKF